MNTLKLFEGGNVFKSADGTPLTRRINQSEVPGTIDWLEQLTGIDFTTDIDPATKTPARWLGSTGKVPSSGDLDLAVDSAKVNKEQLAAVLTQWAQRQGQDPKLWVKKAGEVHLRTPINGDPKQGYVQTDFMFFPNLDWGTFYYGGGWNSAYKGMNRNVLMSSIAKQLGFKVGANGMFDRDTNQLISGGQDPDRVAKLLLGSSASRVDLANVESIFAALAQDKNKEIKVKDFREYIAKEGLPQPDSIKEETDTNFLARLRDRIVNQGMQPLVEGSSIYQLYEAKEPRIPYVEDLVFKAGLRGLQQALDIVKQSAENTKQYVTIKWDGSPALIFGRKSTGEFVLTDKSGATAVGYDGLATSPRMIKQIMAKRDADSAAKGKPQDRTGLAKMYADIWPYFEAAVPPDFRGYVKGDLLYFPQKPYVEDAGNFVFTPNTVQYRIPIASPLGQQIAGTQVGIAMHSQMEDPGSPETPITKDLSTMFNTVPGLMMTLASVKNLQNIVPDRAVMQQLQRIARGSAGKSIEQLLRPDELRAMKITDLPALMEQFINSLRGTDYSGATPAAFAQWLKTAVSPQKFANIVEYLQSPKSNLQGMSAVFTAWNLLHDLKTDLQQQLDLQQPGQEGWVMATPAGRAKLVSRRAGGFAAANRAKNAPG